MGYLNSIGNLAIVLALTMVCAFFLLLSQVNLLVLLFVALIFIGLVFKSNDFAIYSIIAVVFLASYLIGFGFLPRATKWFVEITIFCLFLKAIANKKTRGEMLYLPLGGFFFLSSVIFFTYAILIAQINPITAVLGWRVHFKYILLFYALLNLNLERQYFEKIFKIFLIVAGVQIPVVILQHYFGSPFGQLTIEDSSGGTFGWGDTTGFLAIYIGSIICWLMAVPLKRFHAITFISLLFVPIFFAQSLASFITIPLAIMVVKLADDRKRFHGFIFSVALAALLLFSLFLLSQKYFNYGTVKALSVEAMIAKNMETDVYGRPISQGKGAAFIYGIRLVGRDPLAIFLGKGIGVSTDSYFGDFAGKIKDDFTAARGFELKPQIVRVYVEMGTLGVILYILFFIYLYKSNRRFLRDQKDPIFKSIGMGYYGILFLYFTGLFYRPRFDFDATAFFFWFVSVFICSPNLRNLLFRRNNGKLQILCFKNKS